jgi:hypothetical protein
LAPFQANPFFWRHFRRIRFFGAISGESVFLAPFQANPFFCAISGESVFCAISGESGGDVDESAAEADQISVANFLSGTTTYQVKD